MNKTIPSLTINGITVPANGNVTLVYETAINQYAPLENASTISNTATITGNAPADAATNATITDGETTNYTYDETTGAWSITPGVSTLIITGTV